MVYYTQDKKWRTSEMTIEQLKSWARENQMSELVAELVSGGWELEDALMWVYDGATLTKEQFKAKYFD